MRKAIANVAVFGLLISAGCSATSDQFGYPGERLPRAGDEIMVCGQLYHTGAPVVLWTDPGGYDAYRVECKFDPEVKLPKKGGKNPQPNRYHTMRRHVPEDVQADVYANGWDLETLQQYVDLFVIHYDVCGTSRQCFKILQDMRGLSVHFMLDLDGTIYQTLDVKERAWQTGPANDRSIGIEIANIGAYPNMDTLDKWYAADDDGRMYVTLPGWMGDGGLRTPDYIAYPSRNDPVEGVIQGGKLMQYDLTDDQYDALIKLTATLCTVLPRIAPDAPRDEQGDVRNAVLSPEEFEAFSGLVGHYHVTKRKIDPGPAFDWDRVTEGAQALMKN